MKYNVYASIEASTMCAEIEAESVEEAIEKFWDTNEACPSVCNYCSKQIEIGESVGIHVSDESHEVLHSEMDSHIYYKERIAKLEKRLAKYEDA